MKLGDAPRSLGGALLGLLLLATEAQASPYVGAEASIRPEGGSGLHRTASEVRASPTSGLPEGWIALPDPLLDIETSPHPVVADEIGSPGRPLRIGFEPGIQAMLLRTLPPLRTELLGREVAPDRRPRDAAGREHGLSSSELVTRTVPEPASIVLLTTGLIGLAARRHLLRQGLGPRTS